MKKFNLFFLMAFISLGSVFAQCPTWSLGSPIFKGLDGYEGYNAANDSAWHARVSELYKTRLEYKIYEAPTTWDAATSNVMDVWNVLPEGYSLNKYFVELGKKREPADAADFSATVKYMYDLDNLYVMAKVTDDYIYPLDSAKQESFELMYAPYADSAKMADLFVIDPAFKDTIAKNKWMIDTRQSFAYWGKAGAYKTGIKANGSEDSYIGYEAAYTEAGTVSWSIPLAGLGITSKFAKLSATEYTFMLTVPFSTGMKDYLPAAGKAIAIELKAIDDDFGKTLQADGKHIKIEAASNTNNNDLYIHMIYTGRGIFQGTTGLKNLKESKYSVYPNPAKDQISISNFDQLKKVVILDLAGRELQTINAITSTISLNNLNKGSYFIRMIDNNNFSSTQKLIVR
ncbi:MAG: hypothetical protein AUK44_07755 [Porphyromonadaceae bacterium CG2_30_38_12]|nr:MAG: hypothetical protein AUK44_07755 [Porphyromonadaceae bacterium CG2_30_38_12]